MKPPGGYDHSGKPPATPHNCGHLDRAAVSAALAKFYFHFPRAARELGVATVDLQLLTRHEPDLLDEAFDACAEYVDMAKSRAIRNLHSSRRRRQEQGANVLLALSPGHALSPAPPRSDPPDPNKMTDGLREKNAARWERQRAARLAKASAP
jgi:hypothetical protein